jgi:hypothetical protein
MTGKITPELIIKRHGKFPKGTELLINTYAFAEYKKAVADLLRFGKIVEVENSDVAMIVLSKTDLNEWLKYESSHWHINNLLTKKFDKSLVV